MKKQQQQPKPPPPFACTFTPALPELIMQLNCTILISTYQAGKLLAISAKDNDNFIQLPRNFVRAMAIGIADNKIAIAAKDEIIILASSPGLALNYPKQPNTYDTLFVPRITYYTGNIDTHGLEWGKEGLWAVNTLFSCLCIINEDYSFIPKWQPSFTKKLLPQDQCHLNGMAMKDGKPLYVTALGTGNKTQSWRENKESGGVLIHVPSNEIVLKNLSMPHSPRIYDDKLYMLLSATGEILSVDPKKGKYDVINKVKGFVRGMAKYGDYLFVAHSRLRKSASAFRDLDIAKKSISSGVTVIHIPTGGIVGELKYQTTVDEIFDVQILPNIRRPGILNTMNDVYKLALTTPETSYWAKLKDDQQFQNQQFQNQQH